jgi:hypothetical protein
MLLPECRYPPAGWLQNTYYTGFRWGTDVDCTCKRMYTTVFLTVTPPDWELECIHRTRIVAHVLEIRSIGWWSDTVHAAVVIIRPSDLMLSMFPEGYRVRRLLA